MASLWLNGANFEPVYGWFEQNGAVRVEVWGLEMNRRAALLAYSDGPPDGFSWSNWATAGYDDPSELLGLFQELELVLGDDTQVTTLTGAFPGVFRNTPPL